MPILIKKADRLACLILENGAVVEKTTAECGWPPGSFTGKGAIDADLPFIKRLIAGDRIDPVVNDLLNGVEPHIPLSYFEMEPR